MNEPPGADARPFLAYFIRYLRVATILYALCLASIIALEAVGWIIGRSGVYRAAMSNLWAWVVPVAWITFMSVAGPLFHDKEGNYHMGFTARPNSDMKWSGLMVAILLTAPTAFAFFAGLRHYTL